MKKEKLVDAMSLADDKYVWEARPGRSRNNKMRRLSVIAACLAVFVTVASLWLFVPYNTDPPDVSQYADSEYYDVIKQLNVLTYRKPSDKNNYEKYIEGAFRVMEDSMGMAPPTSEAPMEGESAQPEWNGAEYVEVTDNQVAGVIEGDLFKRSRTHLYYLHGDMLYIYNIAGAASQRVGEFAFTSAAEYAYSYHAYAEMYLSQDGKTVTVIANGYNMDNKGGVIGVISLDVSDPKNVTIKARAELSGSYTSSRMVDGKLLLMSEFYVGMNPDFSDESTFLPQLDTGEGPVSIPAENIILPEKMDSRRYTVVSVFDEGTLQSAGVCAFLSYSQEIYVSPTTVYATHGYSVKDTTPEGYTDRHSMTEIAAVHYADGALTLGNTFAVDGYVKDQYSMDVYDGMLRVVTTTDHVLCVESGDSQGNVLTQIVTDERTGSSASLYVFDDATGALLGSVEHFAPVGETVESVRFDGTAAYVCTAVVVTMTDPVFFFDLSDPANITYTDTGVIEGYSTSLINLGEGFLLGIGVGDTWGSLKIEVYEEDPSAGNGVASVDAWVLENTGYAAEYKSYYIDRENNLVGLPIYENSSGTTKYVLLHFDNYKLRPILTLPIASLGAGPRLTLDNVRATIIEEDLYVLAADQFIVRAVDPSASAMPIQAHEILDIAISVCGAKHDYTTQNLNVNESEWTVEFWEDGAKLPAATVTLDLFGNVMSIDYVE